MFSFPLEGIDVNCVDSLRRSKNLLGRRVTPATTAEKRRRVMPPTACLSSRRMRSPFACSFLFLLLAFVALFVCSSSWPVLSTTSSTRYQPSSRSSLSFPLQLSFFASAAASEDNTTAITIDTTLSHTNSTTENTTTTAHDNTVATNETSVSSTLVAATTDFLTTATLVSTVDSSGGDNNSTFTTVGNTTAATTLEVTEVTAATITNITTEAMPSTIVTTTTTFSSSLETMTTMNGTTADNNTNTTNFGTSLDTHSTAATNLSVSDVTSSSINETGSTEAATTAAMTTIFTTETATTTAAPETSLVESNTTAPFSSSLTTMIVVSEVSDTTDETTATNAQGDETSAEDSTTAAIAANDTTTTTTVPSTSLPTEGANVSSTSQQPTDSSPPTETDALSSSTDNATASTALPATTTPPATTTAFQRLLGVHIYSGELGNTFFADDDAFGPFDHILNSDASIDKLAAFAETINATGLVLDGFDAVVGDPGLGLRLQSMIAKLHSMTSSSSQGSRLLVFAILGTDYAAWSGFLPYQQGAPAASRFDGIVAKADTRAGRPFGPDGLGQELASIVQSSSSPLLIHVSLPSDAYADEISRIQQGYGGASPDAWSIAVSDCREPSMCGGPMFPATLDAVRGQSSPPNTPILLELSAASSSYMGTDGRPQLGDYLLTAEGGGIGGAEAAVASGLGFSLAGADPTLAGVQWFDYFLLSALTIVTKGTTTDTTTMIETTTTIAPTTSATSTTIVTTKPTTLAPTTTTPTTIMTTSLMTTTIATTSTTPTPPPTTLATSTIISTTTTTPTPPPTTTPPPLPTMDPSLAEKRALFYNNDKASVRISLKIENTATGVAFVPASNAVSLSSRGGGGNSTKIGPSCVLERMRALVVEFSSHSHDAAAGGGGGGGMLVTSANIATSTTDVSCRSLDYLLSPSSSPANNNNASVKWPMLGGKDNGAAASVPILNFEMTLSNLIAQISNTFKKAQRPSSYSSSSPSASSSSFASVVDVNITTANPFGFVSIPSSLLTNITSGGGGGVLVNITSLMMSGDSAVARNKNITAAMNGGCAVRASPSASSSASPSASSSSPAAVVRVIGEVQVFLTSVDYGNGTVCSVPSPPSNRNDDNGGSNNYDGAINNKVLFAAPLMMIAVDGGSTSIDYTSFYSTVVSNCSTETSRESGIGSVDFVIVFNRFSNQHNLINVSIASDGATPSSSSAQPTTVLFPTAREAADRFLSLLKRRMNTIGTHDNKTNIGGDSTAADTATDGLLAKAALVGRAARQEGEDGGCSSTAVSANTLAYHLGLVTTSGSGSSGNGFDNDGTTRYASPSSPPPLTGTAPIDDDGIVIVHSADYSFGPFYGPAPERIPLPPIFDPNSQQRTSTTTPLPSDDNKGAAGVGDDDEGSGIDEKTQTILIAVFVPIACLLILLGVIAYCLVENNKKTRHFLSTEQFLSMLEMEAKHGGGTSGDRDDAVRLGDQNVAYVALPKPEFRMPNFEDI